VLGAAQSQYTPPSPKEAREGNKNRHAGGYLLSASPASGARSMPLALVRESGSQIGGKKGREEKRAGEDLTFRGAAASRIAGGRKKKQCAHRSESKGRNPL